MTVVQNNPPFWKLPPPHPLPLPPPPLSPPPSPKSRTRASRVKVAVLVLMAENKRRVSEETEGQYDVKHFKSTGSKLYPVDLIKTEMDMDKVDDENLCTVANGGHVIIMECVACQRAVEVNSQNVLLHQIFGEHSLKPRHQMLSLICFSDGTKPHVVAVQVKKCWWTIEEILTSCDTVERCAC